MGSRAPSMPSGSTYSPGTSYLKPRYPAPPPQAAEGFLQQVMTEKDRFVRYLESLVKNVDRKHLIIGVSLVTTLGLGGAAAFYFHQKQKEQKARRQNSRISFADETTDKNLTAAERKKAEDNSKYGGVLVLHQCPRGRKTPCIAPYPLKLETFLRVSGIHYEVDFNGSEPRHQNSPWITLDFEDISDSQNCLQFIMEKFGIDPEHEYSEKERAIARAYSHLLENHLYWGIALWRWVHDGAKSLRDIQLLPKKTLEVIPDVCRTVEQAAWFHGLGKKSPEDVHSAVLDDLKSLSEYLSTKKFFMGGDKATELDCTAFAMLSQMMWNMDGSPYHKAVKETYKNLADFCWRMRARYWPDWESCLNNTEIADD